MWIFVSKLRENLLRLKLQRMARFKKSLLNLIVHYAFSLLFHLFETMDNEDNEEFGNKEDTKNEGDESELKVDDDDEDLFGDKENDAPSTENNNADASVEETKTESRNQEKEDNLDDLFGSDLDKEEEEKNTEQANETEAPTYGQEEEEEKVEKEPGPPEELEYYPLPKIQKNAEVCLFFFTLSLKEINSLAFLC